MALSNMFGEARVLMRKYPRRSVMRIFVGGLSREATDEELHKAFSVFGKVDSAAVVRDKFSGDSRGFGFVEMPVKGEAEAAITSLHGTDLAGQTVDVNEARPRPSGGRGEGRGDGRGRGPRDRGKGGPDRRPDRGPY